MAPQTGVVTKGTPPPLPPIRSANMQHIIYPIFCPPYSLHILSLEGATGWLRAGRLGSMSVVVPWGSQAKDRQYSVTY
jgi:hypothetical protein